MLLSVGRQECKLWTLQSAAAQDPLSGAAAGGDSAATAAAAANNNKSKPSKWQSLECKESVEAPSSSSSSSSSSPSYFSGLCCWSHDNEFYAVAVAPNKIELRSALRPKLLETLSLDGAAVGNAAADQHQHHQEEIISIQFLSKSRLLLVASRQGRLSCYDMRQRQWSVCCQLGGSTAMATTPEESLVALASEQGRCLSVFSWTKDRTLDVTQTEVARFESAITRLAFSQFRKSLLSVSCEDGTVHLVHTGERRVLHSFQTHQQAVTGLCFSPFNRYLMVTVGLDQRLVLYDVEKMVSVRTMTADAPLQSLAFHSDGTILAVGTVDGRILVYDLSARGKSPVLTVHAHQSAVHAVRFGNMTRMKSSSSSSSSKTPMSAASMSGISTTRPSLSTATPSIRPSLTTSKSSASSEPPTIDQLAKATVNVDQSVNYMDMFSPVVNKTRPVGGLGRSIPPPFKKKAASSQEMTEETMATPVLVKPPVLDAFKKPGMVAVVDDAKTTVQEKASTTAARSTPFPTESLTGMFSPLTSASSSVEKLQEVNAESKRSTLIPAVTKNSAERRSPVAEQPAGAPSPVPTVENKENRPTHPANVPPHASPPMKASKLDHTLHELRDHIVRNVQQQVASAHPAAPAATIASTPATTAATIAATATTSGGIDHPFNTSLLSSVIEDALDDFRREMHRDIQNMHLELIRQFEWQRQEMQTSMGMILQEFQQHQHHQQQQSLDDPMHDFFQRRYL